MKHYHSIPDFRIGGAYSFGDEGRYRLGGEGGVTLESLGSEPLRTAYIATGTPEYDDEGRIVNAIVISPYYSGDSALFYYYWHDGQAGKDFAGGPVVGPGRLVDTDRYYVIFLDALGLWGASKPSDGLGRRFPRYSLFDCVQANYLTLREKLNVGRVRLATGVSMGATQSYCWALLHPEFVDAIMPIGGAGSAERDPVLKWVFHLMGEAMKSDPVWRRTNGDYYHVPKEQGPNRGMMFGWSILLSTGLSPDWRIRQGWNEVRKEVFSWEPQGDDGALLRQYARDYDANDLLARNDTQLGFDIYPHMSEIACPALVMHVRNDQWIRVSLAEDAAKRMPDARFLTFEDPLGHFAVFRAPNVLKDDVEAFFERIGLR